jgi:pimeloyl-ACP methyl ester carboxylesterase
VRGGPRPRARLIQAGDLRAALKALLARPQKTANLEGLLDALGSTDGISNVPRLVAAVQCQEEFLLISPREQAADAAAVRPGYEGPALRFPESSSAMPGWCAERGFAARPEYQTAAVTSDSVPVLAISGQFYPFTPPEWADRATAGFATRYLVTLRNAGHDSALRSTCPIGIVAAFTGEPGRSPDAACAEEPVRFAL